MTEVSRNGKLSAAGTSAAAAIKPFGVGDAAASAVHTTGRSAGASGRGGEALYTVVAAAASRPVAMTEVILAASVIAAVLPE